MRLLDEIIGKEILNSEANIIGTVKDIEIDTSSNKMEFLIATKNAQKGGFGGRFGGSKAEETKIPFEMVSRIGDKILLKQDIVDYGELKYY